MVNKDFQTVVARGLSLAGNGLSAGVSDFGNMALEVIKYDEEFC